VAIGARAHIVVIPDSIVSKRISAVEMARRLRRAGHRVTLLGPGGDYDKIDGSDYVRFDLKLKRPDACIVGKLPLPALGKLRSWTATYADRHHRRNAIVKAVDIEAYRELLKELSPDLLLIDIEAHSYIIPAINLQIPIALFSVFYNLFKSSEAPPLHTSVIPGRGWRGRRLAISWLWLRFIIWKWLRYQAESFRYCGVDQLSLLKDYARQSGVRWQDQLDRYQWLIPFVYRRLPMLVLNPVEMEFTSNPPASTAYVGPMICTNRNQLPFLPDQGPIPLELKSLLETHRRATRTRRLVYCGFGSFFGGDDTEFLKKVIAASAGRKWDMVIGLGARAKPETLGPLPANVTCLCFAPQMELLSTADAAVIHGGMTTVYECIHHSVPMVVYPFTTNDQHGTAARVAKFGLGIVGSRSDDNFTTIRNRIERILDDETIQKQVVRMGRNLARYDQENTVAEVVNQLISQKGEVTGINCGHNPSVS